MISLIYLFQQFVITSSRLFCNISQEKEYKRDILKFYFIENKNIFYQHQKFKKNDENKLKILLKEVSDKCYNSDFSSNPIEKAFLKAMICSKNITISSIALDFYLQFYKTTNKDYFKHYLTTSFFPFFEILMGFMATDITIQRINNKNIIPLGKYFNKMLYLNEINKKGNRYQLSEKEIGMIKTNINIMLLFIDILDYFKGYIDPDTIKLERNFGDMIFFYLLIRFIDLLSFNYIPAVLLEKILYLLYPILCIGEDRYKNKKEYKYICKSLKYQNNRNSLIRIFFYENINNFLKINNNSLYLIHSKILFKLKLLKIIDNTIKKSLKDIEKSYIYSKSFIIPTKNDQLFTRMSSFYCKMNKDNHTKFYDYLFNYVDLMIKKYIEIKNKKFVITFKNTSYDIYDFIASCDISNLFSEYPIYIYLIIKYLYIETKNSIELSKIESKINHLIISMNNKDDIYDILSNIISEIPSFSRSKKLFPMIFSHLHANNILIVKLLREMKNKLLTDKIDRFWINNYLIYLKMVYEYRKFMSEYDFKYLKDFSEIQTELVMIDFSLDVQFHKILQK
ncbi:hypothetical protein TCON_1641 [Astathelohania contejeani]|uniref:Uncharacterized protein n=1 Tax=Astathelohania contejeani TaxID=164912 RepID=A0ABQ7HYD5_9MICR|nr:hypothetical protein TCON_1641 [Thelohania contejeani]